MERKTEDGVWRWRRYNTVHVVASTDESFITGLICRRFRIYFPPERSDSGRAILSPAALGARVVKLTSIVPNFGTPRTIRSTTIKG